MTEYPKGVVDKASWEHVTELDNFGENLTDWEKEFLDSLLKQLRNGKFLTDKQFDTLQKIKERRIK